MIEEDEDSLICDLAETYGIYNYRSLPARTVATLAAGLRSNSRIIQKMSGYPFSFEEMMLISIYDELEWIAWTKTKDAQKGRHAPEKMLSKLLEKHENDDVIVFDSVEDFERTRIEMIRGM